MTNRLRQAFLIAACAAVVGPATANGNPPEATDFSQPIEGAERTGAREHGEAVHRSRVLQAPASFDLAGLAGELRHSELRARQSGGEWTDWTETANGDPVWFGGGMDELQIRTHGWEPSGRVHYVSVTGGGSALSARRGSGGSRPNVVSRRAWGANDSQTGCIPRRNPDYGKVKAAAVHHTVSANNYSEAQARGVVLAICLHHRNANGWDDIGYQTLVDRFGNIYEGRAGGLGRAVVGAQAEGVNRQTTGVAVVGSHASTGASRAAIRGVSRWLAWKLPEHGLQAKGSATLTSAGGATARYPRGTKFRVRRIFGHRASNLTECPGGSLNAQLDTIRRKTARRIGGGGGSGGGGGGIGG